MSSETRPKLTALFILSGLLAGILIGFGVALVLQNRPINDVVPFLQSRSDTAGSGETTQSRRWSNSNRTGLHNTDGSNSVAGADAGDYSSGDSLYTDAMDSLPDLPMESEIVMRDELLGSRRIRLSAGSDPLPQKPAGSATSDTLLSSLTAIKIPEGIPQEYTLEFWRNPLNYKGYKTVRDKIILFGLPPDLPLQLLYLDGNLVLQIQKTQYLLRETSDFLPLIPRKTP